MVTKHYTVNGTTYIVYADGHKTVAHTHYGLSTDEKPVDGVQNGEALVEMDTGKVFTFDEENKTWREM